METLETRIKRLEVISDNLDERVQEHDHEITSIKPAVQIASNRNVAVYLSVIITILNLLMLLLKG